MNFKVRKIRHRRRTWKQVLFSRKTAVIALFLVIGSGFAYFFGPNLIPEKDSEGRVIETFKGLKIDKYKHTNILLLGVAGTAEQGGNLSDSIMIASIDASRPSVSMLSLPRDLYIESKINDRKINEIYAAARYKYGDKKGLEIIQDAVSNFTGINIHYTAVVNFQIFSDIIDMVGGIEIFVPEEIVDPFYPDENYGYQTFVVRKGLQTMGGEKALKYVRTRKTSSDFKRALRQQEVALAMRRKIESLGWAGNIVKIREFYDLFRRRVNTNIGLKEASALAQVGMGIDYGDIVSAVLNDDPNNKGGFLYTPAQEFYGGQFVLLPENEIDTQHFIYLTLANPDILLENAQISILNGSDIEGRAGKLARRLRRMGFHVIETGNYKGEPVVGTMVSDFSNGKTGKTVDFIQKLIDVSKVTGVLPEEDDSDGLIDVQIILGN